MSPADPPSDRTEPSRSRGADSAGGRLSRRALLATAGTVTASALAGCSALRGPEPAPLHDGDWLSYGNGPTNTGRVEGGAPPLTDHAVLASAQWPYAPPAVHDGVVYFPTEQRVVATTPERDERWTGRLEREVCGVVAVDPDRERLYVPTRAVRAAEGSDTVAASVTVLSLADGSVVGVHRVGERATYGVTVDDGDVYARSATACVRLAPDGTERWRQPLQPLVYDEYRLGDSTATQIAPAVTLDGVYVPDRDALVKLDPATGAERWRVTLDTPYAATVVDEGRGVVQTGWRETVAATPSGDVRWRRDLGSRAAAATAGSDVYVAANDLHELDAATGETNWRAHLPGEGTAAPVVTDADVLAVTGDVRAFRREGGGLLGPDRVRWQFSSMHAATSASPVVAAGRLFAVGPHGLLSLRPGADGSE